jgi:hypothetical protein
MIRRHVLGAHERLFGNQLTTSTGHVFAERGCTDRQLRIVVLLDDRADALAVILGVDSISASITLTNGSSLLGRS